MLRPPEHSQVLLASDQAAWLTDPKRGGAIGWRQLPGPVEAQAAANQGALTLVSKPNPNKGEPGECDGNARLRKGWGWEGGRWGGWGGGWGYTRHRTKVP